MSHSSPSVQITFRDMPHSDAVKAHIEEKIEKIKHFYDQIVACHVVVEFASKNQHRGNLYNTRITLAVPRRELVTTHNEDEDMYISIRNAFEDMTRQLEEHVRQMSDGRHQDALMLGKIARVFHSEGFGFIESEDGTEFYFNANHVSHPAFHKLLAGMPVHFVREENSNVKGPQAHRVKALE